MLFLAGTAGIVEVEAVGLSAPVALTCSPASPPPRPMCPSSLLLSFPAAEKRAVRRSLVEGRGGEATLRSDVVRDNVLLGNCGLAVGTRFTKAGEGGERDASTSEQGECSNARWRERWRITADASEIMCGGRPISVVAGKGIRTSFIACVAAAR